MKLTKYLRQYKRGFENALESELQITVDYDPKWDCVESIESVTAYDYHTRASIDLTAIFAETLSDQFEEILDGIDWKEVYSETKGELKAI